MTNISSGRYTHKTQSRNRPSSRSRIQCANERAAAAPLRCRVTKTMTVLAASSDHEITNSAFFLPAFVHAHNQRINEDRS